MKNSIPRTKNERERVLKAVSDVWAKHPHLRLGQLITWFSEQSGDTTFNIPDDKLIKVLSRNAP